MHLPPQHPHLAIGFLFICWLFSPYPSASFVFSLFSTPLSLTLLKRWLYFLSGCWKHFSHTGSLAAHNGAEMRTAWDIAPDLNQSCLSPRPWNSEDNKNPVLLVALAMVQSCVFVVTSSWPALSTHTSCTSHNLHTCPSQCHTKIRQEICQCAPCTFASQIAHPACSLHLNFVTSST